jgi:DnaK suppressor protein
MEAMIMKQEKILTIRQSLVKKMEELWSIADDTISQMKNTDGKYADPFDQAAIESNKFVELACRDRERQLIFAIKQTIVRIDRGAFGICDSCGRTICEKRLLIEPMSRLCTQCQEKHEISNKQKYGRSGIIDISYNHAC